jgi:hypothetical protein
MLGVWTAPVIAAVMMTFWDISSSSFLKIGGRQGIAETEMPWQLSTDSYRQSAAYTYAAKGGGR